MLAPAGQISPLGRKQFSLGLEEGCGEEGENKSVSLLRGTTRLDLAEQFPIRTGISNAETQYFLNVPCPSPDTHQPWGKDAHYASSSHLSNLHPVANA